MIRICLMIKYDGGQNVTSILDDNNVSVYGARILFSPKRKPNLKKYMLLSNFVHFTDTKVFIHGVFNYDAHDDIIQPKHYVALTHWKFYSLFVTSLV